MKFIWSFCWINQAHGVSGFRTQVFSSQTPVLMQEVGILILNRILFAIQPWNPNPEKILLIYLTNQRATTKNFCFWKAMATGQPVDLHIWKVIHPSPVTDSNTGLVCSRIIRVRHWDAVTSPTLKNWLLFGQKFSKFGQITATFTCK